MSSGWVVEWNSVFSSLRGKRRGGLSQVKLGNVALSFRGAYQVRRGERERELRFFIHVNVYIYVNVKSLPRRILSERGEKGWDID
jgi:hypothetical protein